MPAFQNIFIIAVCLTVASGLAATSIVIFGGTRRNQGQKPAPIALFGTTAIFSLLTIVTRHSKTCPPCFLQN